MSTNLQQKKSVEKVSKKKNLNVGDICELKISALAPNNIGIDEFSYPHAVFVPNATYGSTIKAKIVKINPLTTKKDSYYAVAKLLEEVSVSSESANVPVKPGDILTVSISASAKQKGVGIAEVSGNYKLIIPVWNPGAFSPSAMDNNSQVKVKVTRVKASYGFATLLKQTTSQTQKVGLSLSPNPGQSPVPSAQEKNHLSVGSKFTTTLQGSTQKYPGAFGPSNFTVLKIKGSIVFLKDIPGYTLKPSDKVRVKITSASSNGPKALYAVGKILQVNPISQTKKMSLVINSIRDMVNHGMHYGEKAVKCHARMKNAIWLKKQQSPSGAGRQTQNRPLLKKGRHIINLFKTRRCLNKALNMLTKYALKGRTFLFIGTKKPATGLVARASYFTKNSFYVNTRWLGGMLTNWKTICKSISKIRPILKEKQKVVRDILERRQAIKSRLIKKAFLLRKKSKRLLTFGRYLVEIYKNSTKKNLILARAQKLTALRNDLLQKGKDYLQKRQDLIKKRQDLIYKTSILKEKGLQISAKYKSLLNQLAAYTKKLREYKYLLILTSEIQDIKQLPNQKLYSVSYGKLKEVSKNSQGSWILPNPPKEILNRIVNAIPGAYGPSTSPKASNDSRVAAKAEAANILVCSSLLSKFSRFSSYLKSGIQTLITNIQILEAQCKQYSSDILNIKKTLQTYVSLKVSCISELQQLKTKFNNERRVIQIVRRKLKTLDAQKKFIKFLPRLRYLPTPQTKISEIVQILLSKIVDPKLKYSIDNIYDQKETSGSKKLAAARKKKWQRLEKYFGGIANMTKFTKSQISRNVAIIIGQKEEMNAVRECSKLGIKMFTIVDTNCNPTLSDHVIPANDDSRNSIKYILTKFITRIRLAQKIRSRILKLKK
jgi:ribosomal protein S2/predicted RNA-binding protein with TRAM domain